MIRNIYRRIGWVGFSGCNPGVLLGFAGFPRGFPGSPEAALVFVFQQLLRFVREKNTFLSRRVFDQHAYRPAAPRVPLPVGSVLCGLCAPEEGVEGCREAIRVWAALFMTTN
jgi:hypothetical protein